MIRNNIIFLKMWDVNNSLMEKYDQANANCSLICGSSTLFYLMFSEIIPELTNAGALGIGECD